MTCHLRWLVHIARTISRLRNSSRVLDERGAVTGPLQLDLAVVELVWKEHVVGVFPLHQKKKDPVRSVTAKGGVACGRDVCAATEIVLVSEWSLQPG